MTNALEGPDMNDLQIKAIVEEAAEIGAKKALAQVGLHDENAGNDVKELRSLLEMWRDTRRTVTQTITRTITTAILTALAASFWFNYWPKDK